MILKYFIWFMKGLKGSKLESGAKKLFFCYKKGFKGCVIHELNTKEFLISRYTSFLKHIIRYNIINSSPTTNCSLYSTRNSTQATTQFFTLQNISIELPINNIYPSL